jgi:galacturan 1,4-alpha-galacturonidase
MKTRFCFLALVRIHLTNSYSMRPSFLLALTVAAVGSLATYHKKPLQYPPGGPSSIEEFREKYPYNPRMYDSHRRVVTIHPSRNDLDDISAAFYGGLRNANHGGTLYLPNNQTFVIGKPLDLTFLDDVDVRLDGKILFTNDTAYWQANAFSYPFQSSRMFWKWSGKNIKIYGTGTIDGNGQRWWNEIGANDVGKRPVLFYGENLSNFAMEGITLKDSPMWNQLYVTCQ